MLDAAGVNYLSAQSCDEMNTSVEESLYNRFLVDGLLNRTPLWMTIIVNILPRTISLDKHLL